MLQLVYHPDDRLARVAEPLETISAETARLAEEMIETMHDARGVGLAGPQVGRMERLFVVHVPDDQPRVYINPRIVAISPDEGPYEEGCLSIPGVYAEVKRPLEITVEAWDAAGNAVRHDAGGLLARVILHEYDHLEGVLFLDHLSRRKQERLLKAYRPPTGIEAPIGTETPAGTEMPTETETPSHE